MAERFINFISSINIIDSYATIILDNKKVDKILKQRKLNNRPTIELIQELINYSVAVGFDVYILPNGGILDFKFKLIYEATKSHNLNITTYTADRLFESYLYSYYEFKIDNKFKRYILTKSGDDPTSTISTEHLFPILYLIGSDWFSYHFLKGAKPKNRLIKGLGLDSVRALLYKYSTLKNIFHNIDSMPKTYVEPIKIIYENFKKQKFDLCTTGFYSHEDLMPYDGEIKIRTESLLKRNSESIIKFYKKNQLDEMAEEEEIKFLTKSQGLSKTKAMQKIRGDAIEQYNENFYCLDNAISKPVVYRILNKSNGKMYFGSTNDIRKRSQTHFRDLQYSLHKNYKMNDDTCRIPDDRKDVLQTNADAKRTSLSWPSLGFCS